MRWIPCLAVAAAIQLPAVVYGQEVGVSGWLDRFDKTNSTISIRSLGGNRTISVAPNVVVRLNGAAVRLDQLPANSSLSITTQKDPNGVLRATEITATTSTRAPQPSAAAPAGALVRGTLVGMDIPNNSITLRTNSGDHKIPLGTAPIYVNGVRGSTRNLRVGQVIQVERALPTEASQEYVTQMVRVLPAQTVNPKTGAAGNSTIRTRTAGSRSTYRSQPQRTRSQRATSSQRVRRQTLRPTVWKGIAFQPVISFPGEAPVEQPAPVVGNGVQRAPARATVPPALPAASAGDVVAPVEPGAVVVDPSAAAVAPDGTVVVPGAAVVSPGGVVVSPGTAATTPLTPDTTGANAPGATGVIGTAPQTTIPDARIQSPATAATAPVTGGAGVIDRGTALGVPGATAVDPRVQALPQAGVADPRAQSLGTPGAVPPAVADPRNQGVVAPGVVAPGAIAPPANVPDPRFQGIVTPGAVLPAAPAGVGTPATGPVVTPGAILPGAAAPPVGVPDPRFQAPAAPGLVRPGVVSPVFPGPARRPLALPIRPPVIRPQVPAPAPPAPAAPR